MKKLLILSFLYCCYGSITALAQLRGILAPLPAQRLQKIQITVPADDAPFYFCSQDANSGTAMNGIYTIMDDNGASVQFSMANAVDLTANVLFNDTPTVFQNGSFITVGVSNGFSYLAITVSSGYGLDTDFTIYAQGDFAGELSTTNLTGLGGGSSFNLDLTKSMSTSGTFGCNTISVNGVTSPQIYAGRTSIGNLATSITINIGHTMNSTNYTPSVSFIGAAGNIPWFDTFTTSNFVMHITGIAGGDNLNWSVIEHK